MAGVLRTFILRDGGVRERAIEFLAGLDITKLYEVVIRIHKSKRTRDQNARYWAILGIVESETGHTANEVHEWCKHEFLGFDVIEIFGARVEIPKSTTGLNTKQFAKYCERVEAWAVSELGVRL